MQALVTKGPVAVSVSSLLSVLWKLHRSATLESKPKHSGSGFGDSMDSSHDSNGVRKDQRSTVPSTVLGGADGWEMYLNGIYGDCSKDAVIDHAVTLIAYGKASGTSSATRRGELLMVNELFVNSWLLVVYELHQETYLKKPGNYHFVDEELSQKYWTIQNSWGQIFGEQGTMRLLRQDSEESGSVLALRSSAVLTVSPNSERAVMVGLRKSRFVVCPVGASQATSSARPRPDVVPSGGEMPWPAIVLGGIGLGALAARGGLRALRASGVKMNFNMPSFSGMTGGLQGFEAPMTRAEAKKILNIGSVAPSKDTVREAHRRLLIANHPDKGGSTYIASKINEAKEVISKVTSQRWLSNTASRAAAGPAAAFLTMPGEFQGDQGKTAVLFGNANDVRTKMVLVAAKAADVDVKFEAQKGEEAPYLQFDKKTIKYTGAMLRFMGRFHENTEVDMWLDWSLMEFAAPPDSLDKAALREGFEGEAINSIHWVHC
eukprot:Skav219377  [mRNA]  locus=scaffold76:692716:705432:- [translate_table: standard]